MQIVPVSSGNVEAVTALIATSAVIRRSKIAMTTLMKKAVLQDLPVSIKHSAPSEPPGQKVVSQIDVYTTLNPNLTK